MIKLLIMDADGVLIANALFSETLARDYTVDNDKMREFFTGAFQQCLVGKADLKESVAPYLPSFGWPGTVDEFLQYWFKTCHNIDEALVGYLQQLRGTGLRVVLATNNEKYRVQYMLEHMGFDDVFDKVYSSAHLGLTKPAMEFFAKVIEDNGVARDEVLFWDDDQRNINGALEYGIAARTYKDYESFLRVVCDEYGMPTPDMPVPTAA